MAIIHKNITSAECHEDKLIIDADTTDAGKIITPSSVVNGAGVLRNLQRTEIEGYQDTEWCLIQDKQYTLASRLDCPAGQWTRLTVKPAFGGATNGTTESLAGFADSIWDEVLNKLRVGAGVSLGDSFHISIQLTAQSATPDNFIDIRTALEDGIPTKTYGNTIIMPKPANTPTDMNINTSFFVGASFLSYGLMIQVNPENNITLYDVNLIINRLRKV